MYAVPFVRPCSRLMQGRRLHALWQLDSNHAQCSACPAAVPHRWLRCTRPPLQAAHLPQPPR